MSNYKSNLQANNQSIGANNIDLQALIDQANALPDAGGGGEQATPEISVNSSGLITATAGTKSTTKQLTTKSATTYTPTTTNQTIASGTYLTGTQTIKGDSNLKAENIKNGVSIFGINGNYEGSGSSGNAVEYSTNEDAMVTGELRVYNNNRVTSIGSCAFYSHHSLLSVNFPLCTEIGDSAFYSCFNLVSANFPVCTEIGDSAFYSCFNLSSINFPICSYIGDAAFYSCGELTSINFPLCTSIGSSAFRSCDELTSINFPVCSRIAKYAFYSCYSLTSANFPLCTSIGDAAFYDCSKLTSANFPVCTTIRSGAFSSCYRLSSLILGASSVCTLSNSNAFYSTPYAGYSNYFSGTPYIYVPSSLVTAYQTATHWSYFSNYFSAIENLGEANLITFTIDNTEYQAEEGMTFGEWVKSEYNTGSWSIMGDFIVQFEPTLLKKSTVIEDGVSYSSS